MEMGEDGLALADFLAAADADPSCVAAHEYAGAILALSEDVASRSGALAVKHAKRACELTEWKDSAPIELLAAACAEAGDFEQAVRLQKMALAMPVASGHSTLAERRVRLTLYEAHKPRRLSRERQSPPPATQPR